MSDTARAAAVVFVDPDASAPVHDGSSWADAFVDLQEALDAAEAAAGTVNEIWVAAGTYRPSKRTDSDDLRSATFQLLSGVGLYGGFFGNETSRDQRNPQAFETILTGDLAGDDGPNFANNDENTYHVVTGSGSGTDPTAIIDGFTITAGNADGPFPLFDRGAGMYNSGANPTVTNCTFRENLAPLRLGEGFGGGMYNVNSSPTLRDCIFSRNRATQSGGGMHNDNSGPALVNCIFVGNVGSVRGGGMANVGSNPTLINCVFSGNRSVFAFDGGWGGGMSNRGSNPTLTNCTFSRNEAWEDGGGIYNGGPHGAPPLPVLTNCILWGNMALNTFFPEEAQIWGGTPVINYTCIEGLTGALGGVGNIGDDPLFINDLGPDGILGTKDDNLRFRSGSPCVDAGNSDADTDAGTPGVQPLPTFDLGGGGRFVDDPVTPDTGIGSPPIVDMGAYEYQDDCNNNGVIDSLDISSGASEDGNNNVIPDDCEAGGTEDCNNNGSSDLCDLFNGASEDINENGVPDECECVFGIYGDVDHDGDVDLFDLFCILNGFSGDFSVCSLEDVDLEPCRGDGDIDLFDLFAVLNAFAGDPLCPTCP